MKSAVLAVCTIASALGFAQLAHGKADTARISISGPGIEGEIASSAAGAIAANVWTGSFAQAGRESAAPDAGLARHLVKFYIDAGEGRMRLVYAVYYVWDPAARRALVQLPGRGDPWFRLNVGTILHDGSDGSALRDGRWYHASEDWAGAIRALLPGA